MEAKASVGKFAQPVQDMLTQYVSATNKVASLNTDMFFDVMAKNFNFACMMRDSVDAMYANVVNNQQRMVSDMLQMAQEYMAKMPDTVVVK